MSLKVHLNDIYNHINICFAYYGNHTEEESSFPNIFLKVSEDYFKTLLPQVMYHEDLSSSKKCISSVITMHTL